MANEIERRFLIRKMPAKLKRYPTAEILQGYLAITGDYELRLRQEGKEYFQAAKRGSGVKRSVTPDVPISEEFFLTFWPFTENRRVVKTRFLIPCGKAMAELDVYHGKCEGYVHVEVEFVSSEESRNFVPPDWFGREVTEDPRHSNKNLALYGPPEESQKSGSIDQAESGSAIPTFELEKGLARVRDIAVSLSSSKSRPLIISVAGGSASGKTDKVATEIKKWFGEKALILSLDDYYRGVPFMEAAKKMGKKLNWDQPESMELDLAVRHIEELRKRRSIMRPTYQVKTGLRAGAEKVDPRDIIIVEGNFALEDTIASHIDLGIFVDIGAHGRLMRRLMRDVHRTDWKPADILRYFSEIVQPMHEKYVETGKKNAHIVIVNEYNPAVESERSGLHEVQLKFRKLIDDDQLRRLGAERIGSADQYDTYYNPSDRDLSQTGEMVRIRTENGYYILTYKGPKSDSVFRRRSKFECEIDKDAAEKLLLIYIHKAREIKKRRVFYQLSGVIISLDSVVKVEGGKNIDLGKFMEIRCAEHDQYQEWEKIMLVIEKLGLKLEERIVKSYAEM